MSNKNKLTTLQRIENFIMGVYLGIFIVLVLGGAYVVGKVIIDVLSKAKGSFSSILMSYLG